MKILSRAALLLLPTIAVSASLANAQVVILNQPPTQTFSLDANLGFESLADNFIVTEAAGIQLNQVKWWGTWNPGGMLVGDTFDILIHGNMPVAFPGDVPSGNIATFNGLTPTVAATGATMATSVGQLNEFELSVTLPSPVLLAPGTYWIEIYSTNSGGGSNLFVWGFANEDPIHGDTKMVWATATPGVIWNAGTPLPATDMALELKASPAVENTGNAYCFGDGSGTFCPCSAFGAPGSGCQTTSGLGATLVGSGHAEVASDGFALDISGAPANKPGLFFQGTNALTVPAGDGILCSNSNLRYAVNFTDAAGNVHQSGFGVNAAPGTTLNYQYWFRDPSNPCNSGGFNFSNGWVVTWQ